VNDKLVISGGSDVENILSMIIFDRWGNSVFSANNFLPDDALKAWDGTLKGKVLNPGVFAYRMIVDVAGQQEIVYGDVTLVR